MPPFNKQKLVKFPLRGSTVIFLGGGVGGGGG